MLSLIGSGGIVYLLVFGFPSQTGNSFGRQQKITQTALPFVLIAFACMFRSSTSLTPWLLDLGLGKVQQ